MTLFLKLGATNAWRNLARSALAVLSMALAAAFLTNAISLSRGYPAMYCHPYRAILGGEIMVYDLPFSGEIPEGQSTWSYQKSGGSPFTDLDVFFPELTQRGYLSSADQILPLDNATQERLGAVAGVTGVYPRYQMPARTEVFDFVRETPLRGRDVALDQKQTMTPADLVVNGRWLSAEDEGRKVAVVSVHQQKPLEIREPRVGEMLHVSVPRLRQTSMGIALDYQNPLTVELEIIGTIEINTRTLSVSRSGAGGESVNINQQMRWMLDDIQIPLSTWYDIWAEAADFTYQPRELALMIEDMAYIEDQVLALKQSFPELTFMHVPYLASKAESQLLIENLAGLSTAEVATLREMSDRNEQSAMPIDLRGPLSLLIFLNAALVIAANLLIMINERKVEIGILKAVGAQARQIVSMALAEALLIALVGAGGGFAFIRLPAMLNQLTNRTPLPQLIGSISFDFLLVLAASLTASLLFGFIPALRMAGLSVNEVLRNE